MSNDLRMPNEIKLAKIGPIQTIDVEKSGQEMHNDYARTCTVMQGSPPKSDIGDTVPRTIAKRYGTNPLYKNPLYWNRHFIVQVAGCPLQCPYCYLDNLTEGEHIAIETMVDWYITFRARAKDLNVFHLMGGCPGAYAPLWPDIRRELDERGLEDTVLLSDVILLEDLIYDVSPWKFIPERSIIVLSIKGTSFFNYYANTGTNLFPESMTELQTYLTYLTALDNTPKLQLQLHAHITNPNPEDIELLTSYLHPIPTDIIKVKDYEVVKWRKSQTTGKRR